MDSVLILKNKYQILSLCMFASVQFNVKCCSASYLLYRDDSCCMGDLTLVYVKKKIHFLPTELTMSKLSSDTTTSYCSKITSTTYINQVMCLCVFVYPFLFLVYDYDFVRV